MERLSKAFRLPWGLKRAVDFGWTDRVEAARLAVSLRPVAALGEGQEPECASGEARSRGGLGPVMRSLALTALLIAGSSAALAQNAPPRDGYPPPAAGASGTPATYGPPAPGVIPGAPGPVYSHHYRHAHHYIVIPRARDYGPWPQGQYRWFPFGPARWGYWCEPVSYYHLNCGVAD